MKITKRSVALLVVLTLLVGGVIGGTIAFLTTKTETVENTFTVGDINITLEETTEEYKVVPGATIEKDPTVTVKADSEKCYLFVKVEEENWSEKLAYEIADGWTKLDGETGVYYRVVDAADTDAEFAVLKDDQVEASEDLTKTELEAMGKAAPKLSFTAYAVQFDNVDDAQAAWDEVK